VGNFGRSPFLIIIALVFLLLIVLPLLNRRSSSGLTDSERAERTQETLDRVTAAEKRYYAANKRYTEHIADLVPLTPKRRITLVDDLSDGFAILLDAGQAGKTYLVQVGSTVLTLNKVFKNGTQIAASCLSLKNAGDKYCARDQPKDPLLAPRK
jgi:hypothetical protein